MSSDPPFPTVLESRLLAAIVFTDTVGFSARVQAAEPPSLKLLEEDFAVMQNFSREMGGTVLKTTGDGLLLYFTSAVHAVSWALKTQRHFAARAKGKPQGEVFRHRIGVHVGDVFVKEGDVMGDGVNVASRVQGEAPAGGICISQTVYDMVKNKLELYVIRLEPRRLKNLRENVQMYHLLLEEPARPLAAAPALAPPVSVTARRAARRSGVWPGFALVGLALAGVVLWRISVAHQEELARSQASQAALGALLSERKANGARLEAAANAAPAGLDFARLTTPGPAGPGPARQEAELAVTALEQWVQTRLQRFTRERPLLVQDLRRAQADRSLYATADGQLHMAEGPAIRKFTWTSVRPELQGAIVVSVLRSAGEPAPREVIRGAEAFGYLHGLPEMAAALLRERSAETLFSR